MINKIEKLIEEKCPKGVEFKPIKELAEVGTGSSNRQDEVEGGVYPFYVRSKDIHRSNKYLFDETAIIIPGEGGVGDIYHFVQGKYDLHQRAYRIHFISSDINPRFAYYYFRNSFKGFILKKSVSATVTSIRKPMIEEFMIPVPPIEIQAEIVGVLDSFVELKTELEAELTKRKQQYAFFREKMLSLENYKGEVKKTQLGDIATFYNGDRGKNYPNANDMVKDGVPFINAGDVSGIIDFENCKKITEEKYDQLGGVKLKKNDIVYCLRGSTGKNGIYDRDGGTVASSLVAIRVDDSVNYKYVYYLLNSNMELRQRMKADTGAAQPNLSAQNVKKYVFPIPNIAEQNRIVEVLDSFSLLTESIFDGLPAEIEARHRQYEYYRDKLLTFKERVV